MRNSNSEGWNRLDGFAILGNSAPRRIMIVEDDPVSALLLRRVLENRGYMVDHAENGLLALDIFKDGEHRVIITDWMMPEMDGVALCREVRQLSKAYTYVLLLSAKGQRQDRLEAFEAGVDDFLSKPLDREELFARLKVAERILAQEDMLRKQTDEITVASERLQMANQNLLLASRRFEELFAGMPVASFTFDSEGMIHEWNRAAEALFKRSAQQSVLRPVWSVLGGGDNSFWDPQMVGQIFKGESVQDTDWTFRVPEGESRHLVANVFALRGVNGEIIGAISANLDITERKEAERRIEEQKLALEDANQKLETLAVTDGLTGLSNHRRFQEEVESAFSSHVRMHFPLSMILLDVDNFKQYNDAYGHPAGDDVLKKVAKVLTETSRNYEVVARYGGEEFAVLLPGTSKEQAMLASERFRIAIEQQPWPMRPITASFGVASLDPSMTNPRDLIQNADAALYASKQNGRNCSTHFEHIGSLLEDSMHVALKKTA
jgi:two-component system, cell cycle response regulator